MLRKALTCNAAPQLHGLRLLPAILLPCSCLPGRCPPAHAERFAHALPPTLNSSVLGYKTKDTVQPTTPGHCQGKMLWDPHDSNQKPQIPSRDRECNFDLSSDVEQIYTVIAELCSLVNISATKPATWQRHCSQRGTHTRDGRLPREPRGEVLSSSFAAPQCSSSLKAIQIIPATIPTALRGGCAVILQKQS